MNEYVIVRDSSTTVTLQKSHGAWQSLTNGSTLPEQHDDNLREHMEAAGNNHYGLYEVSNNPDFPSVLGPVYRLSLQNAWRGRKYPVRQTGMQCTAESLVDVTDL